MEAVLTDKHISDETARNSNGWFLDGQRHASAVLEAGLYIVATPIGNLGDISFRALATLAGADVIACEDTRVSRVLMQRYGIERQLVPYHEHNSAEMMPRLLDWLAEGRRIALISDAGTPLISDPGYRLVREVLAAGHMVVPLPGANAAIAALAVSGLPTDAFFFGGFLPARQGERRSRLSQLAQIPGTLVFYETPHRVDEALEDMVAVLGAGREAVLARELTKLHEEVRRLPLGDLLTSVRADRPRGEIVLLIAPPQAQAEDGDDLDVMLRAALAVSAPGKAAADIAKATGRPRKEIYARALQLAHGADEDN